MLPVRRNAMLPVKYIIVPEDGHVQKWLDKNGKLSSTPQFREVRGAARALRDEQRVYDAAQKLKEPGVYEVEYTEKRGTTVEKHPHGTLVAVRHISPQTTKVSMTVDGFVARWKTEELVRQIGGVFALRDALPSTGDSFIVLRTHLEKASVDIGDRFVILDEPVTQVELKKLT